MWRAQPTQQMGHQEGFSPQGPDSRQLPSTLRWRPSSVQSPGQQPPLRQPRTRTRWMKHVLSGHTQGSSASTPSIAPDRSTHISRIAADHARRGTIAGTHTQRTGESRTDASGGNEEAGGAQPSEQQLDRPQQERQRRRIQDLAPSVLRPRCAAKDRLQCWVPIRAHQADTPALADEDIAGIVATLAGGWEDSTRTTYGAGLLAFHALCDTRGIPEEERAPASEDLILFFLASLVGSYSDSTLENYVAGLRAWHIIHRLPWNLGPDVKAVIKRAGARAQGPECTRDLKPACSRENLLQLREHLNFMDGKDAAIFACATTAFYTMARIGELLPAAQKGRFNPARHISIDKVERDVEDRYGNRVTIFHLPWTKVASRGQDVFWAEQDDDTDPKAALAWHIAQNQPSPRGFLFAYYTTSAAGKRVRRPLTIPAFLSRLRSMAAVAPEVARLTGHSFRIGGTVWCLLRSIPFEIVKAKGRWKGDSFQLYLRRHAEIMAPYIQADGDVWQAVVTYMRNVVLCERARGDS